MHVNRPSILFLSSSTTNCETEKNIKIRNIGFPLRQNKYLNYYCIILNYDAQTMQIQHLVNNMFHKQNANVDEAFT